jgi:hypothetical protein
MLDSNYIRLHCIMLADKEEVLEPQPPSATEDGLYEQNSTTKFLSNGISHPDRG